MLSAQDALARLRAGNRRFVIGSHELLTVADEARRGDVAGGQEPFAAVLGCADSRVPVELLFDQGLGDIFVVRVAGNIATATETGSLEYAVQHLNVRLVVVLGHSDCGAVTATLAELDNPTPDLSPNLAEILGRIAPVVAPVPGADAIGHEQRLQQAIRANTLATVQRLREKSPVLAEAIRNDGLLVVGAEYDLASGEVEFFDEPSP